MTRNLTLIFFLSLLSAFAVAQPGGGGAPLAPLNPPNAPPENPTTTPKVYLGKALFWEEQLSSTKTVACGTCHVPGSGGSDPRADVSERLRVNPGSDNIYDTDDDILGSPGVPLNHIEGTYEWSDLYGMDEQITGRKTPSSIDAAYSDSLFWDGRAIQVFRDPITNQVLIPGGAALESQALGPPLSSAEMSHVDRDWLQAAEQIENAVPLALSPKVPAALANWIAGRDYPDLFQEAFGSPDVTPARIAMAIAAYERVLYSDQTPLDLFLRGQGDALTEQEVQGMALFNANRCRNCHEGALLTDNRFHYIGVRPGDEDDGRAGITGNNNQQGEFRTPGLRNVGLRPNFFHNGQFTTLEEVVDFYNRGGDFEEPNLNNNIRNLGLNAQERAALVAFLGRPLTDPRVAAELAPFDRPTLYSESEWVPQITGQGRAGQGGFVPMVKVVEPPMAGNTSFTVGVSDALAGARAVLVIDEIDPGVTAAVPDSAALEWAEITLSNNGLGQGAGYGSISLDLPTDPNLVEQTFYGRWYVEDPGAGNGLAISPVFSFTVFADQQNSWCTTDITGDGKADLLDFITLANQYGDCPVPCSGDLNASGAVDDEDFTLLLQGWRSCL